jgi:hypothetical protein
MNNNFKQFYYERTKVEMTCDLCTPIGLIDDVWMQLYCLS